VRLKNLSKKIIRRIDIYVLRVRSKQEKNVLVIKMSEINDKLVNACERGDLDEVEFLIEEGADLHAYCDDPLRYASYYGHLNIVKFLIGKGVNVHSQDNYALRYASRNGHLELVKYLTKQGADIHSYGDSSLRWAISNGHLEVVKYFIKDLNKQEKMYWLLKCLK